MIYKILGRLVLSGISYIIIYTFSLCIHCEVRNHYDLDETYAHLFPISEM